MVRYPLTSSALRQRIRRLKPSWLAEAKARTGWLKQKKAYIGDKQDGPKVPDWGEIKPVYRALQGHACAYCGRPLPADAHHTREHDVEHFRPKGRTTSWGGQTPGRPAGYYWLAYEPLNYCISCATCNQGRKRDRFPIEGTAGDSPNRVKHLNGKEIPVLLYPVSDVDDDPEDHLTFIGHLPAPTQRADGTQSPRGKAVIEFFELDTRKELLQGRAMLIVLLQGQLELAARGDQTAADIVENFKRRDQRHASCLRAHLRLFNTNPQKAAIIAESVRMYIANQP